jgi:hypothetical protein
MAVSASDEALEAIAVYATGDARTALNLLELAATTAGPEGITQESLANVLGRKTLLYDKSGGTSISSPRCTNPSARAMFRRHYTGSRGCWKRERIAFTLRGA